MLRESVIIAALVAGGFLPAGADEIQLRDKSAVTGKILAEKKDSVVVDIGYTALVIPRDQIANISKTGTAEIHNTPEIPGKTSPGFVARVSGPHTNSVAAREGATNSGHYEVSATPPPLREVRELVSLLGEAVVQVRTPSGLGSGFIINDDGFLMTNFHVIEGETQISVEVYHQRGGQLERKAYKDVRIVAINKFEDMALLKIEEKDAKFKTVLLGDSDALAVGETVFAIGSPLGLERTVTEGIVSTKTREMQGELYMQTTAQINPGNSGGPLFNLRGEVVGITNMKITFGEGLGFAIPINTVKYFLDHRDAFAYSNDNPSNPYRYLEPPSREKQTRESAH